MIALPDVIKKNLDKAFVPFFTLFCLIPMVIDASALWIVSYYILLLPVFMWQILRFWPVNKPRLFELSVFLFIAYFGARSAIGAEGVKDAIFYLLIAMPPMLFCWMSVDFFTCDGKRLDFFIWIFVAITVVMSATVLIPYIIEADLTVRLQGPAMLEHPIRGVSVIALAAVLALWQAFRAKKIHWQILAYLCYIILFFTVLFAQSRALLIAVFLPSLMFLIHGQRIKEESKKIWFLSILHGGLMIMAIASIAIIMGERLMIRGVDSRLEIWSQVWGQFTNMPIWGHGMAQMLILEPPVAHINHAHNFYLSILYYGGFVGLGLFLFVIFIVACMAFNQLEISLTIPMIALFLFTQATIMTDTYKILGSPDEVWLYFWLPCCIIVGQYRYRQLDWRLKNDTAI